MKDVHASGAPAVLVAVYGNRAYEKALVELDALLLVDQVFVQTALCFDGGLCCYPVDRSFYFSSVRGISSLGLRIVRSMDYGDISVLVFLASGAGDEVCVHQADFIAWEHTEVFADRLLHEVFALDVQLTFRYVLFRPLPDNPQRKGYAQLAGR